MKKAQSRSTNRGHRRGCSKSYADPPLEAAMQAGSLRGLPPKAPTDRGVTSKQTPKTAPMETIATLPGGWDLAHAIRLGIKPFAELGANSEALSGSQVDSPCSCRAI